MKKPSDLIAGIVGPLMVCLSAAIPFNMAKNRHIQMSSAPDASDLRTANEQTIQVYSDSAENSDKNADLNGNEKYTKAAKRISHIRKTVSNVIRHLATAVATIQQQQQIVMQRARKIRNSDNMEKAGDRITPIQDGNEQRLETDLSADKMQTQANSLGQYIYVLTANGFEQRPIPPEYRQYYNSQEVCA